MCKYELWVDVNYRRGDTHTNKQTHKRINTITRPDIGAGPSENYVMGGNAAYGRHQCQQPQTLLDLLVPIIPLGRHGRERYF